MPAVSFLTLALALGTLVQDDGLSDLRERGAVVAHRDALDAQSSDGFERAYSDALFEPDFVSLQTLFAEADPAANTPDPDRAAGFYLLKERLQLTTRYAEALDALRASVAADPREVRADELALLEIAADQPPLQRGGASGTVVPTQIDRINQIRAEIALSGGQSVSAILDTGAEISVAMQSVAEDAGFTFLDGSVNVGTTTAPVSGRLAVAPQLAIGDMEFTHVLFLVLPDEMLTFINGEYTLDMIIGLPVFLAAGQMEWADGGTTLRLGDAVAPLTDANSAMFWHEDGLGLADRIHETVGATHFDSGASRSQLRPRILDLLSPEEQAQLEAREQTVTGLGGSETRQASRASGITLGLGGAAVTFDQIDIVADEDNSQGDIAMIGNNVIRRARSFAIDFETLRYAIEMED